MMMKAAGQAGTLSRSRPPSLRRQNWQPETVPIETLVKMQQTVS
jgi:hypothetical protein